MSFSEPQRVPEPQGDRIPMKCWIPGGVVLKNGKRINYRDTLGHWQRKAVGEDRVIWRKGDKVYTGDWIPHTSWVGKNPDGTTSSPCVLTHHCTKKKGKQHQWYCKFRFMSAVPSPGFHGQLEYHLQLVLDCRDAPIPPGWEVHHWNDDSTCNLLENLWVVTEGWHKAHHAEERGRRGGQESQRQQKRQRQGY